MTDCTAELPELSRRVYTTIAFLHFLYESEGETEKTGPATAKTTSSTMLVDEEQQHVVRQCLLLTPHVGD